MTARSQGVVTLQKDLLVGGAALERPLN